MRNLRQKSQKYRIIKKINFLIFTYLIYFNINNNNIVLIYFKILIFINELKKVWYFSVFIISKKG